MSKYDPLKQLLARSGEPTIDLTFGQIEQIVGFALPPSARRYPAWWSNSGGAHVQSLAWLGAGYQTQDVDLRAESVRFVIAASGGVGEMPQTGFDEGSEPKPSKAKNMKADAPAPHPAFGAWRGLVTLDPNYDYTQPADPDWGKVYED